MSSERIGDSGKGKKGKEKLEERSFTGRTTCVYDYEGMKIDDFAAGKCHDWDLNVGIRGPLVSG